MAGIAKRPAAPVAAAILAASALAAEPALAQAGGDSFWDHNGSVMRLVASGNQRRFEYERPRPGLVAIGIAPGTVVFEGRRDGASYSGIAYTFKAGCEAAVYRVSGRLRTETEIVVGGAAPVWGGACDLAGYSQTSPHATLRFTYICRGEGCY